MNPETPDQETSWASLDLVSWLVPAALTFLWVTQWSIGSFDRFLSWDEAVYFSQVADGHIATDLAVQRSRAVAFVAWPVGVLTDSVVVLRIYLLALVTAGFLWIGLTLRPAGVGPQLGMAVFIVSATPMFHAGELSANLWVAILALAVVTLVAFPRTQRSFDLALLAIVAMVLVWIRPPDGALFLLGVGVAMLVWRRIRDIRRLVALTVGGLAGLGVWMVDAISRLDGLSSAVDGVGNQVTTGLGFRLGLYADMLDGPLRGANLDGISVFAVIPWIGISIGVVAGVFRLRHSSVPESASSRIVATLAFVGGLLITLEYFVGTVSRSVRYIYPAWLLLSVSAGLFALGSNKPQRRWVVWVLLSVLALGQLSLLRPISDRELNNRGQAEAVGMFLSERSGGGPCAAAAEFAAPQVSFAGNCRVTRTEDLASAHLWLEDRAAEGAVAYIVVAGEPTPEQAALGQYEIIRIDDQQFWSALLVEAP